MQSFRVVFQASVLMAGLATVSGCLLVVPMGASGAMRLVEYERAVASLPTPNPTLPMVSTPEAPKTVVLTGSGTPQPPLVPVVISGSRRASPNPWPATR